MIEGEHIPQEESELKTGETIDNEPNKGPENIMKEYAWFEKWYNREIKSETKRKDFLYGVAKMLFREFIFRVLSTKVEMEGKENFLKIPKDKGFLIIAPHMSQIDPQLLITSLGERKLDFLGGQIANFRNKYAREILLKVGTIPIFEPRRQDFLKSSKHSGRFQNSKLSKEEFAGFTQKSIEVAARRINQGSVVVIFPEGPVMEKKQTELRKSTRGPVRILNELKKIGMPVENIIVLPIAIEGSSSVRENPIGSKVTDFHRGKRIKINIGQVVSLEEVINKSGEDLQNQSDYLMLQIAELMPEELRGPYKNSKL